jgi:hypothetical protein
MTGAGGAGGFTGTSAMGPIEKPMGIVGKALFLPQRPVKKKKDRKTAVRETAQRVVDRLLDDEQSDSKASGDGDAVGRHA